MEVVKERSGCAKSAGQPDSWTARQSDGLSGTQIFWRRGGNDLDMWLKEDKLLE